MFKKIIICFRKYLAMRKLRDPRLVWGQTIIEAMVAISIALTGLLGILTLVSASLAFTNDASQKFVASYLAAEGIEIVKNIIDTNIANGFEWDTGINIGVSPAVSYETSAANPILQRAATLSQLKLLNGQYLYDNMSGVATPYKRAVQIIKNDANTITVDAVVSWEARGKTLSVAVRDVFKRWR